jgi:hypothetical protein
MSSFNAKRKYGLFNAWAEHERIAALHCEKALKWSEFRAIRSAVASLVVNMSKPLLTQKEIEHCKSYLDAKRKKRDIADTGLKYRILWRSLDNCPMICKIYGRLTMAYHLIKNRLKGKK